MAFAVGDRCRVRLTSTALAASRVQPQPPLIGVVTRMNGGAASIVFADGTVLLAVNPAFLEKLTAPSADERNAVIDKIVNGVNPAGDQFSSEMTGRVVDVYGVQPGASGDVATRVLVQTLNDGPYYEMAYTDLMVIEDR